MAFSANPSPAPVPLGNLEAFWRYSPVLGPVLERGRGLEKIPDYLLHGDFPYHKRPFAREVPFADHLSVVRLLGGYDDGSAEGTADAAVRARDLAYRGPDGKICYRMQLLRPRLQPYLDCGYTNLTIVLDNVPWCFPEHPAVNSRYGQGYPPRDSQEWHDFVKALCVELARIMGPDAARQLRFRVGTENNGLPRFNGSQAEYLRHYDATARAVQAVLPGAKFGPFNICGASVDGIERQNVNAYALAEYCAARKLPLDWVAFSRYFRPGDDPARHAEICRAIWEEFARRVPQLKGVSREIHEFGVAPFGEVEKGVFVSAEPGALGAALRCQMMWLLRAAGINRLWHWSSAEDFDRASDDGKLLFTSQAWLLCVMEHMVGGDTYVWPALGKSPSDTRYVAAGSFKKDHAQILISAYNPDVSKHTTETVSFRVPAKLWPHTKTAAHFVRLTPQTSVFDRIRRDLAAAGLLVADYVQRPDRLGVVSQMASKDRAAEKLVEAHWDEYTNQWVESLTLKSLPPEIGHLQVGTEGVIVNLRLTAPEILVLDLKK